MLRKRWPPLRVVVYPATVQGDGAATSIVRAIRVANEQQAYALSDRGTWLSMSARLPGLRLLVGGRSIAENRDPGLRNRYGVMAVDPAVHPGVNAEAAAKFVQWIRSPETQGAIGEFGVKRFGQSLFYPDAGTRR